jgi:aspartate aminotransferase-like enzyme
VREPIAEAGVELLRERFDVDVDGGGDLSEHIGYFDVFDITTALAAVELTLAEAGADIERGVAVTRALEAFEHAKV